MLEELARILHVHYGVSVVCVCKTIRRKNGRVGDSELLTQYLRVVLEPLEFAIYSFIEGTWDFGLQKNSYCYLTAFI